MMLTSELGQKFGLSATLVLSTLFILLRYFIFAGVAYLVFYVWKKRKLIQYKIQQRFPKPRQIVNEVVNSVVSSAIFGVFAVSVSVMKKNGLTQIYDHLSSRGLVYLFFSIAVLIVLHDTYFYWMHRLMHRPKVFKIFHQVHHRSHNPTPWASFSFQPAEAVLEFAFLPMVVYLVPLHMVAILTWSIWMIVWNVTGHLGYEFFPQGFVSHPFWKWFNTSTHHNLHHQKSNGNFGLYFNFWDRMMDTNTTGYETDFEKITSRK